MSRVHPLALGLAIAAGLAAPSLAEPPSFRGLGSVPGYPGSYANAVSADGTTVVGFSGTYNAFRWTAKSGMVALGSLGFSTDSQANGVSADGSVVVGYTNMPPPTSFKRPFRWTASGGMQALVDPAFIESFAYGVSYDGQTAVGYYATQWGYGAFDWTVAWGFNGVGLPEGGQNAGAAAVSGDGHVVVGACQLPTSAEWCRMAFRWSDTGTVGVALGDLPGAEESSVACAVSYDGSVITGSSASTIAPNQGGGGGEAFRWTAAGGMQGLGVLPGGSASRGFGISSDGNVIVGTSNIAPSYWRAFMWRPGSGMRDLRDILVSQYGVNMTGWTLTRATGVSSDGKTIVGWGTNPAGVPEAWMAHLADSPPPCYANCDGSAAPPILNFADFGCFLQRFAAGDPYANCDGSTMPPMLNVADFTCFLGRYAGGCP